MNSINKAFKENIAAIATSVVVFLFISYYLMNYIPSREKNIDNYNRARLNEFTSQFSSSIIGLSDEIDRDSVESRLTKENIKQKGSVAKSKLITDYINCYFIDSIEIKSVIKEKNNVVIARSVHVVADTLLSTWHGKKLPIKSCTINDTLPLKLKLLKKRLANACAFANWVIFIDMDKYNKKNEDVFLENGVEQSEIDSMHIRQGILGKTFFIFSDKRFYARTIRVFDTSFIIVCAVNQSQHEKQSRKPSNVFITIICILIVIILFLVIPLVKPIISSSKEKLTQVDLLSSATSIAICSVIVSAFIFVTFLSNVKSEKIAETLKSQNELIAKNLKDDFNHYKHVNNYIFRTLDLTKKVFTHCDIDSLKNLYFVSASNTIKIPDVCFRIDSSGYMTTEINHKENYNFRRRFNERDYFKKISGGNRGYYHSSISALFSKLDNSFKFTYLEKRGDSNSYEGCDYKPELDIPTSMDKSYGFMLCNKEGKVLLHRDEKKNVNENIYNLSPQKDKLLQLLRGFPVEPFRLEYEGEQCLFFGKKMQYINKTQLRSPLYLITFKRLKFEDGLIIYSLLRCVIISLSFIILCAMMLFVYSSFYYSGHLSMFSKAHVYWLFPDRSKQAEFKFLTVLNYAACSFPLIYLRFFQEHVLFLSLITGYNLAFLNFLLLTQRVYSLKKRHLLLLITVILLALSFSLLLYFASYPSMALTISVFAHLLCLWFFKKKSIKYGAKVKKTSGKYSYNWFLTSVVSFNCIVLPATIIISVFNFETTNLNMYTNSYKERTLVSSIQEYLPERSWALTDAFLKYPGMMGQPSQEAMFSYDFDYPIKQQMKSPFAEYFGVKCLSKTIILIFTICGLTLIIAGIIEVYSGRFFFFDLSALHKRDYLTYQNEEINMRPQRKFVNAQFIIPPFSHIDIAKLKNNEIDRYDFSDDNDFKNLLDDDSVTKKKKVDLILSKAFEINKKDYLKIWTKFSESEKFAMYDFAIDYFVNYKNKRHIANLIKQDIIITDPITGRLRVMNYSFRNFVIYYEKLDPNFSAADIESRTKGNFAKWKLPLLIVAIGFLTLMMYLYKEQYNQVMIIGGSVFSTITIIARFLNNYKK